MSGFYEESHITNFIYFEDGVGLKVQKSSNDKAYRRNARMIEELGETVKKRSEEIYKVLSRSYKDELPDLFQDFSKDYKFYREGQSGWEKFPTYSYDKNAEKIRDLIGKRTSIKINESPTVIINFKAYPDDKKITEIIQLLKEKKLLTTDLD